MPELLLLEGEDLPELMVRVREEFGPRATIVRAERVRRGGLGGFFAREHFELTVEVPEPPRPAPAAGVDVLEVLLDAADRAEAAPPVSTSGARFAAVLQGVRALAGDDEPAAAPRTGPTSTVPRPALVVRPPEPAAGGPEDPGWGRLAVALLAAGVPSELLDQAGSVAEVLERIPRAPAAPRGPGQVLVLVGPRDATASVAALLRLQWRLPDAAVVEAGPAGLTSTAAVVRWRVRTGEAPHPWLLVVGVGDDPTARVLAGGLVAAAQPDQVWAVVDARTKPDDAARWLEQVGGARPADALAIHGLLDTSDPGTVLGLGVPVAWADGVPASPVLWATVLGQGIDLALGPRR